MTIESKGDVITDVSLTERGHLEAICIDDARIIIGTLTNDITALKTRLAVLEKETETAKFLQSEAETERDELRYIRSEASKVAAKAKAVACLDNRRDDAVEFKILKMQKALNEFRIRFPRIGT